MHVLANSKPKVTIDFIKFKKKKKKAHVREHRNCTVPKAMCIRFWQHLLPNSLLTFKK